MKFLRQILVASACLSGLPAVGEEAASLRDAYAGNFDIGVAISTPQVHDPHRRALELVFEQFSSVTPENLMKWHHLHPAPGKYDFRNADMLVDIAHRHDLKVIGHTLVWHSQCPDWVFVDEAGRPLAREPLVERLREHIRTVVGRYKGKVFGWDVVNEAFNDDGTLRDSKWRQQIGDDYIELAFRFAREADPEAELYYNDYSLELPAKRRAVMAMIHDFRSHGVPIDGVGVQGHWRLDSPSEATIDETLGDLGSTGVAVMVTELDVDVLPRPNRIKGADVSQRASLRVGLDPYRDGLPPNVGQKQADRYAAFFRLFEKHDDAITRVTIWGVDDSQTWHNDWPIPGRTAHSLLFDRAMRPKPAYWAVFNAAKGL